MIHAMCGRYSITTPVDGIRELFRVDSGINLQPRYNVAPTQPVPAVRAAKDGRELTFLLWGLIPGWAKDATIAAKLINARTETIAEKPSFRGAFKYRRCLLPADGFYEWTGSKGPKQPWRITLETGGPFGFAGIWENWMDPNGSEIETCAIVTTEAAESIAHIHHRMPVILKPEDHETWLNGAPDDAQPLMRPYDGALAFHAVSRRVNRVANDDAALLEPVEPEMPAEQLGLF
jgi:putative SOS response-associated peptidase YedK